MMAPPLLGSTSACSVEVLPGPPYTPACVWTRMRCYEPPALVGKDLSLKCGCAAGPPVYTCASKDMERGAQDERGRRC